MSIACRTVVSFAAVYAGPSASTTARDDGEREHLAEVHELEAVLEVVRLLGELVGPPHGLALEVAAGREVQALGVHVGKREVAPPGRVLEDALARVVREVEAGVLVALLEDVDDAHGLVVVLERADLRRDLRLDRDRGLAARENAVQHLLARMPERRVAEVVAERAGLGEVLVQGERPGHRPRDLRDLERVREARPVVVALERNEDLRLVLEPAERARVDDAVAVPLVLRPVVVRLPFLGDRVPPHGARRARGVDREPRVLLGLELPLRESGNEGATGEGAVTRRS